MNMKKGWCPTLARPMESGDGLLVRLNIHSGTITTRDAREVATLAARYGNGQIDLTSRGNLQIRGVTQENYAPLFDALTELGFTEETRTPKQTPAELELGYDSDEKTLNVGLPFGRISADVLLWVAEHSSEHIGLSGARAMTLYHVEASLLQEAQAQGFIIHNDDPRRLIEACSGAPACASAQGDTRALALSIAKKFPQLSRTVHISGCAKGCACARKTDVAIVANKGAYNVAFSATAQDAPMHAALSKEEVLKMLEAA